MEKHVKQNLIKLGVKKGDRVGAAVSGGVDSMVLLHCLCKLRQEMNIIITVYHMEHGIRGENSIDDMNFVAAACKKYNVSCTLESADVPALAEKKKVSIETAARLARYEFLDKQKADFIATAHHMDDMAETVIMNLVRGSGLAGLCGIPEKRGRYIRPMLDILKQEIEQYAKKQGIEFVYDRTNEDTTYTRNYIRKEILPRLQKINDNAAANIARTTRLLSEDEQALEFAAKSAHCIETAHDAVYIDLKKFTAQETAVRKRIIRLAISTKFDLKDVENAHVQSILNLVQRGRSAKKVDIKRGIFAAMVYEKLMIGKNKEKRYNDSLADVVMGRQAFEETVFECSAHDGEIVFAAGVEYFDADAIKGAAFRHRKEGDIISPLGLGGKKRLSDYLSDRKVPLLDRDGLILLAKRSEIFWIVGIGVSEKSKIKKNSSIIKIKYWEKSHE